MLLQLAPSNPRTVRKLSFKWLIMQHNEPAGKYMQMLNEPFSRDGWKAVHLGSISTNLLHYSCVVKVNCALLNSRKTGQYSQADSMLRMLRWGGVRGGLGLAGWWTHFQKYTAFSTEDWIVLTRYERRVFKLCVISGTSRAIINPKGWFKVTGCISL